MENQEMNVLLGVKKVEITKLANEKQQQLTETLNAMLTQSGVVFSQLAKLKDDAQVQINQQQNMLEDLAQQWLKDCNIEQEFAQLKEKFNGEISNQDMMKLLDETTQSLEQRIQRNSEEALSQVDSLKKQGAELFDNIRRQVKQLYRQTVDKRECNFKHRLLGGLTRSKLGLANVLEKCAGKLKTA